MKHQKNGKTHHYIYYHCTKKKNKHCAQGSIQEKDLFPQIDGVFDTLEIPAEFHQYALKWFGKEYEKEIGSRNAILTTQQKEYKASLNKLDRLIEMRAAGELTAEEFATAKGEALKKKAGQQELLKETDQRVDNWFQIAEDMLTFIQDAREKLLNGPEDQKRQILFALGSNHLLKDQNLAITLQKPLIPMEQVAFEAKKINAALEPPKNRLTQQDYELAYASSPIVSSILEIVRTVFAACGGEEIPPQKIRKAAEPHR